MDLIAGMLEPAQNLALLHRIGELGHRDLSAHCFFHRPIVGRKIVTARLSMTELAETATDQD